MPHMGALALAGLEPGDHVCWTFDSEPSRLDATAGFVRSGIRAEHKIVYHTAALPPADVIAGLSERGIDAAGMARIGQLEVATAAETYLAGGHFDLAACMSGWADTCARAQAQGFAALRIVGDMAWACNGVPGAEALAHYEASVNAVYAEGYAMAVCQYDRRKFSRDQLRLVGSAHPGTLHADGRDRATPLLRIRYAGPAALRLVGDSDLSNRAAVEAALAALSAEADRHQRTVRLDLSELRFADSATAGALLECAARTPTGVTITGCRPGLAELLDLFGGSRVRNLRY
jgi:anti-anti-sigma regulatory factor